MCGIVRAAPTLPAWGLVGVLGAFPGGPAGRWRVSVANPLWCGLVLGPSLVGGVCAVLSLCIPWACASSPFD